MSAAFVVDCSLAMTWLFKDELTALTEQLFRRLASETAIVPSLWFIEVANVLAFAEQKRRVTSGQVMTFLADIERLTLEIDDDMTERAFTHILPLCRSHQLTSYDAIYLDLALRRQLPLATLDEPLRKAAKKVGVKMLGK